MIAADALGPWEPLRIDQVAALFRRAPFAWWIAGGWALDLFIGHQTRPHDDVEIAILRRDQMALQRWLRTWELWYVPAPGAGLAHWAPDTLLAADVHEIWCRPDADARWQLEVLIEEADADRWRYRRDDRVVAPLQQISIEVRGIPVVRPEIALLYKSMGSRERDEEDFRTVLSHLDDGSRAWLRKALETVGTGSGWLEALN
jgi:hypothetical protein